MSDTLLVCRCVRHHEPMSDTLLVCRCVGYHDGSANEVSTTDLISALVVLPLLGKSAEASLKNPTHNQGRRLNGMREWARMGTNDKLKCRTVAEQRIKT